MAVNPEPLVVNRMGIYFRDRSDAGRQLASFLGPGLKQPVVLAIPRGGILVAVEIAESLGCALGLVVPRKIPITFSPEAGYGAVAEDGTIVLNDPLVAQLGLSRSEVEHQAGNVLKEIRRRGSLYREHLPGPVEVKGRDAVIVDDGLASGFTMIAAIRSVKNKQAASVTVAVPVASESAYQRVRKEARVVAAVIASAGMFAVASFYENWHDLDDNEAIGYLDSWTARR